MKLLTGMRIGQSQGEFMAAILFSAFLHATVIVAAVYFAVTFKPRTYVPPFYSVKLVDLPADLSQVKPLAAPEPAAPPVVRKPDAVKARAPKHTAPPAKQKAAARDAMPELNAGKKQKTDETAEQPGVKPAKPQEAVSVAAAEGETDFPFLPYLAIIRDKVQRNWNPPPGAKGATAKVMFRILLSGRVGEAKLLETSGNFYFDQAAMRAILASSPFPPLPEGFSRDQATFSVDLIEKE